MGDQINVDVQVAKKENKYKKVDSVTGWYIKDVINGVEQDGYCIYAESNKGEISIAIPYEELLRIVAEVEKNSGTYTNRFTNVRLSSTADEELNTGCKCGCGRN